MFHRKIMCFFWKNEMLTTTAAPDTKSNPLICCHNKKIKVNFCCIAAVVIRLTNKQTKNTYIYCLLFMRCTCTRNNKTITMSTSMPKFPRKYLLKIKRPVYLKINLRFLSNKEVMFIVD